MPPDDETWALVRHAYCDTTASVADICRTFSLTSAQLYARRAAEGWPYRGPVQPKPKPKPTASAPAPSPAQPSGSASNAPTAPHAPAQHSRATPRDLRAALLQRLYNAIDLKLNQLEKHMTSSNDVSSADHERDTRALTSLVRSFERVTEFDPDRANRTAAATGPAAADPAASSPVLATAADAERLRRDIAQRLERILEKRNAAGDAG